MTTAHDFATMLAPTKPVWKIRKYSARIADGRRKSVWVEYSDGFSDCFPNQLSMRAPVRP